MTWSESAVRESLQAEKQKNRVLRKELRDRKAALIELEAEKHELIADISRLTVDGTRSLGQIGELQLSARELEVENELLGDRVKIYEQDIELMSETISKHIQREKAQRLSAQAEAHYLERGHLDAAKQLVKPDRAEQPTA